MERAAKEKIAHENLCRRLYQGRVSRPFQATHWMVTGHVSMCWLLVTYVHEEKKKKIGACFVKLFQKWFKKKRKQKHNTWLGIFMTWSVKISKSLIAIFSLDLHTYVHNKQKIKLLRSRAWKYFMVFLWNATKKIQYEIRETYENNTWLVSFHDLKCENIIFNLFAIYVHDQKYNTWLSWSTLP